MPPWALVYLSISSTVEAPRSQSAVGCVTCRRARATDTRGACRHDPVLVRSCHVGACACRASIIRERAHACANRCSHGCAFCHPGARATPRPTWTPDMRPCHPRLAAALWPRLQAHLWTRPQAAGAAALAVTAMAAAAAATAAAAAGAAAATMPWQKQPYVPPEPALVVVV